MSRSEHLPADSGTDRESVEISLERHEIRTLLVNGHLTGFEFLARMSALDERAEKDNRRRFAIYMRMLEAEKNRQSSQRKETFAERQTAQAFELLASLKAKLNLAQA